MQKELVGYRQYSFFHKILGAACTLISFNSALVLPSLHLYEFVFHSVSHFFSCSDLFLSIALRAVNNYADITAETKKPGFFFRVTKGGFECFIRIELVVEDFVSLIATSFSFIAAGVSFESKASKTCIVSATVRRLDCDEGAPSAVMTSKPQTCLQKKVLHMVNNNFSHALGSNINLNCIDLVSVVAKLVILSRMLRKLDVQFLFTSASQGSRK